MQDFAHSTMRPKLDTARSYLQTSDGVRLFYQDWGQGRPIVFVHAWAMSSDAWQYNMADFEGHGFRCVAMDRRGHGRSDRPRDGYAIERLAQDLGELLEALDLRDVALMGHCLGGAECVHYLASGGTDRVSSLILLAPGTPSLSKTPANPEGFDPEVARDTWSRWLRDFPHWVEQGADAFFRPAVFGISREMVESTKRLVAGTPLQIAMRTNLAFGQVDLGDALRSLRLPTLIIHGDADASIPVQFGRATAKLVKHAEYREYAGAPHGLYLTHRKPIHDDVCAFLRRGR